MEKLQITKNRKFNGFNVFKTGFNSIDTLEKQIEFTKNRYNHYLNLKGYEEEYYSELKNYLGKLSKQLEEIYESKKRNLKIKKLDYTFKYNTKDDPIKFLKELKSLDLKAYKIEDLEKRIDENIEYVNLRRKLNILHANKSRQDNEKEIEKVHKRTKEMKYIYNYKDKKRKRYTSIEDLQHRQIVITGLKNFSGGYEKNELCIKVAIFDFNNTFKHRQIDEKFKFLSKFIYKIFDTDKIELTICVAYKEKEQYLVKNLDDIIERATKQTLATDYIYKKNNLFKVLNLATEDPKGGVVSGVKL